MERKRYFDYLLTRLHKTDVETIQSVIETRKRSGRVTTTEDDIMLVRAILDKYDYGFNIRELTIDYLLNEKV